MTDYRKRRRLQVLAIVTLIMVAIAGVYAYKEFTRSTVTTAEARTVSSHNAMDLLAEFEADSTVSNKYSGSVLEITGTVKAFEGSEGISIVYLGNAGQSSSIRCVIDSSFTLPSTLEEGMVLTVKGTCVGYEQDPLLGTDVVMSRCIIVNN